MTKINEHQFFGPHNIHENAARKAPKNYIKQELITYLEVDGVIKKISVDRLFKESLSVDGYSSEILKRG